MAKTSPPHGKTQAGRHAGRKSKRNPSSRGHALRRHGNRKVSSGASDETPKSLQSRAAFIPETDDDAIIQTNLVLLAVNKILRQDGGAPSGAGVTLPPR